MLKNNYKERSAYIRLKTQSANDIKYKLQKHIYEMDGLSYANGSRKGDFEIRDGVEKISEEINRFYEYLRLFDSAKDGDAHALEDILVFFQNNFIDSCTVTAALRDLNSAIIEQTRLDKQHNKFINDSRLKRTKNIYLAELQNQIDQFDSRFQNNIAPALREFLNDINSLHFFNIIEKCLNTKTGSNNNLKHSTIIESELYTFIWIYVKINTKASTPTEITDLLAGEITRMGIDNQVLAITGMTSNEFREHIKDIIIEIPDTIATNENRLFKSQSAILQKENNKNHINTRIHLQTLINSIYNLNTGSPSQFIEEYSDCSGLAKAKKKDRSLFHASSAFGVTLKTVCDYHSNSLMFIISWILTEIKTNPDISSYMQPLIKILDEIEYFIGLFGTALLVTTEKSNVIITVLNNETKAYIPSSLAHLLVETIHSNCKNLDQAFSESNIECDLQTLPDRITRVFSKKLEIIREAHHDATKRIKKYINDVES
ncbi:MAG: hypothetical protein PF637_08710 [Spirochaetes bacterium]|jgi:hypothetical protein|nr:hypothetical protein [Spirochaetota bacterium]